MLIPFIGQSPHGMMNASALETGPGFHSACDYLPRKACYSFIIHRSSEPKQLCMSGLLKTTMPAATAGSRTLASRVRVKRTTDWAISACCVRWLYVKFDFLCSCIDQWFRINRSCPEHPGDWSLTQELRLHLGNETKLFAEGASFSVALFTVEMNDQWYTTRRCDTDLTVGIWIDSGGLVYSNEYG